MSVRVKINNIWSTINKSVIKIGGIYYNTGRSKLLFNLNPPVLPKMISLPATIHLRVLTGEYVEKEVELSVILIGTTWYVYEYFRGTSVYGKEIKKYDMPVMVIELEQPWKNWYGKLLDTKGNNWTVETDFDKLVEVPHSLLYNIDDSKPITMTYPIEWKDLFKF